MTIVLIIVKASAYPKNSVTPIATMYTAAVLLVFPAGALILLRRKGNSFYARAWKIYEFLFLVKK